MDINTKSVWSERKATNQSHRDGDHRNPFQRDKARILHSAAFRRLQAKTQVLGVGMSDFYRTRLTHSLEASQIGQGIAAQLRSKYPDLTHELELNDHLIEALCLAHDIGHPPFGHGGEIALNCMMNDHGGFEGNGQTFRIINKLEPYTAENGMNLSRRTILGLVKYPNFIDNLKNTTGQQPVKGALRQIKAREWHPPKGLYTCDENIFDWLVSPLTSQDQQNLMIMNTDNAKHSRTRFKSFDCSIMELADDIAYAIHDLEDAIVMKIVSQEQFELEVVTPLRQLDDLLLSSQISVLSKKLFSQHHYERKDAIGALVNSFITSISIQQCDIEFVEPLLKFNAVFPEQFANALNLFKDFVFKRVILKPELQIIEYKGQQIVMELFQAFESDPERLLPESTQDRWKRASAEGYGNRAISDYIAGMTDGYASKLYTDLFLPKSGNLNENHAF